MRLPIRCSGGRVDRRSAMSASRRDRSWIAFAVTTCRWMSGYSARQRVTMGREALKWHLDYLNAVKLGVQAAVDAGATLEQTVQRVALPEFGGYALFGWVHPGLNVPAAYKDLAKPRK
jgi:hypothetical protein